MMKKRILKVIGLLGVCGILEITTPAVTFAETSTTDTVFQKWLSWIFLFFCNISIPG